MRQKRAKAYRKLMSLYSLTFGFRQPYQVLGTCSLTALMMAHSSIEHPAVDSHMCKEAVAHKIELVKQLGIVLQGTVKPSESSYSSFPPRQHLRGQNRGNEDRTFADHAPGEAALQ